MDAKARTIRLPITLVRNQRKLARAENALALKLDRPPTDAELAAEADLTLEDLHALRDAARAVTSLDRPLGEEEDAAFGDLLPSDGPSPEDEVHISLRTDALKAALGELPDRERQVVEMRYGIAGAEPTPLREIGRQLGITPERVRQIESRALGRLGRMRELAALREAASPARVKTEAAGAWPARRQTSASLGRADSGLTGSASSAAAAWLSPSRSTSVRSSASRPSQRTAARSYWSGSARRMTRSIAAASATPMRGSSAAAARTRTRFPVASARWNRE
jgi:RNA polymerase sigma factor (sigma-70 family)